LILAMLVWIPAEWWGNSIAPSEPANQPVQQTAPSPSDNNGQIVPDSSPTPTQ
jgi:hypothetical protein